MQDKALIEIKIEAKIEVHHHHDSAEHAEILRKLDALVENSKSLNPRERKLLQRLVDDLESLGKD